MAMRFNDAQLQNALVAWRALTDVMERSKADNVWFEQRVSAARQATFEVETIGASDPTALRKAHVDYWSEFVRVDTGDPIHSMQRLHPQTSAQSMTSKRSSASRDWIDL